MVDVSVPAFPAPVKAAAALLGYCTPEVRLPLAPLSEAARRRVESALAEWQATQTTAIAA